jgi:hypothetical protein
MLKEFDIFFEDEQYDLPFSVTAEDEDAAVAQFIEHIPRFFDCDEPRKVIVRQVIRMPEKNYIIGRDLKVNKVD